MVPESSGGQMVPENLWGHGTRKLQGDKWQLWQQPTANSKQPAGGGGDDGGDGYDDDDDDVIVMITRTMTMTIAMTTSMMMMVIYRDEFKMDYAHPHS